MDEILDIAGTSGCANLIFEMLREKAGTSVKYCRRREIEWCISKVGHPLKTNQLKTKVHLHYILAYLIENKEYGH
jgi:hypothetical protein